MKKWKLFIPVGWGVLSQCHKPRCCVISANIFSLRQQQQKKKRKKREKKGQKRKKKRKKNQLIYKLWKLKRYIHIILVYNLNPLILQHSRDWNHRAVLSDWRLFLYSADVLHKSLGLRDILNEMPLHLEKREKWFYCTLPI